MPKTVISTEQAPQAIGPYSQAIEAGGFVFISGQIPLDPVTGTLVSNGIEAQTRQVLENIKAILSAAALDLTNVVKTTILLADINNFTMVNDIYGEYFSREFPARATYQVAALPKGALIEIEAIAHRG